MYVLSLSLAISPISSTAVCTGNSILFAFGKRKSEYARDKSRDCVCIFLIHYFEANIHISVFSLY